MSPPWPVPVVALNPVSCGTVLWSRDGTVYATLLVKATFGLTPRGTARLLAPAELVTRDQHEGKTAGASVSHAAEIAPLLPRAGVMLTGHAYVAEPRPAAAVRLAVFRDRALVDKTLHVFGDRRPEDPGKPAPFQRLPLRYERAYGGPRVAENPVGTGAEPGSMLPNVIDPKDPRKPAGFGPISSLWAPRRDLLAGRVAAPHLAFLGAEGPPDLSQGFPFGYFQAAPADQQLDTIVGDEWLVLDGLHPSLPRLETRLPGARAVARVRFEGGEGPRALTPVDLEADTLVINADQQTCFIVWRGILPIGPSQEAARALRAYVAIEGTGMPPFAWPEEITAAAPPKAPPLNPVSNEEEGTAVVALDKLDLRAVMPFLQTAESPGEIADETSTTLTMLIDARAPAGESGVLPFIVPLPVTPNIPSHPHHHDLSALPFVAPPLTTPPPTAPIPDTPAHHDAPALPFVAPPRPAIHETFTPSAVSAGAPIDAQRDAGPGASRFFHAIERPDHAGGQDPSAPKPYEPPPRKSDGIPIVASGPLAVATIAWQVRPPSDSITVVVKGTFTIVPDSRAIPRDEPEPPMGDLYVDDDPNKALVHASDFAILKPKADVLAAGKAWAPGGSSPAMRVSLRFGKGKNRFDRSLEVLGDRRWQKTVIALGPTDPEPFTSMPITYDRAFGGPGFDKNPLGVGYKAAAGEDGAARLPNIEQKGQLIRSPSDTPDPAGFGPIPVTNKERWGKLGTYDARWFKLRWPYFPEDFDYAFFQSAPAGQRLDHLDGDEPFEIVGMHPDHPSIQGELPALRAHAYAQMTPEAGGAFKAIALTLDTASFDMESLTLHLVWRGLLEVSDEDAPEIRAIFAMASPMSEPAPSIEDARARYLAAITPEPAPPLSPEPEVVANDTEPEDERDAESEAADAKIREELRAAGVPDDVLHTPPPPPDVGAIAESLRAGGASEEDIAEVIAAVTAKDEPEPKADPIDLRAQVIAMLKNDVAFDELDLTGADLRDLDLSGRSFVRASLRGANLGGARLTGASLAGASLAGADMTDATLAECDLTAADLTGATLERAHFEGATLTLADMTDAKGTGARFDGAKGERAVLAGGMWDDAVFDGAQLIGADLSRASIRRTSFEGASIPEVRLYDAKGGETIFKGATMTGARVEQASLLKSSFEGVSAEGAVFEKAILDTSTFHRAKLAGASFFRASCMRVIFAGADLTEGRLRRANLAGASFVEANLMKATLERADLHLADLRGANLHAAGLWKATLDHTKMDRAILTQSTLARRS